MPSVRNLLRLSGSNRQPDRKLSVAVNLGRTVIFHSSSFRAMNLLIIMLEHAKHRRDISLRLLLKNSRTKAGIAFSFRESAIVL